mmetsp:Transcript_50539/g.131344  ORF Transcript_50539/g.131344 Transcript_50539/m.131344 type:complete len:211 (+) Transcript_50539:1023-1655(+)
MPFRQHQWLWWVELGSNTLQYADLLLQATSIVDTRVAVPIEAGDHVGGVQHLHEMCIPHADSYTRIAGGIQKHRKAAIFHPAHRPMGRLITGFVRDDHSRNLCADNSVDPTRGFLARTMGTYSRHQRKIVRLRHVLEGFVVVEEYIGSWVLLVPTVCNEDSQGCNRKFPGIAQLTVDHGSVPRLGREDVDDVVARIRRHIICSLNAFPTS